MMVIQNSCFFIMFFYIFSISTNFIVRGRNLQLATSKIIGGAIAPPAPPLPPALVLEYIPVAL